jgi:hypothetical protein
MALAMFRSLRTHLPDSVLYALCLDDDVYRQLSAAAIPGVVPIDLDEFEGSEPRLAQIKTERTMAEYCFTCSPVLPGFVFEKFPEVPLVTYVDADLFFFSSPEPLFEDLDGYDVGIVPHRFPRRARWAEKYGRFNVGWVSFRRTAAGLELIQRWRSQCLEWCFDRIEDGKFADQRYLDEWPAISNAVRVITHPGANLAPWNAAGHRISFRKGKVLVDGAPLIFFHFQGFRAISPSAFRTNFSRYLARPGRVVREHIFAPYVRALAAQGPIPLLPRPRPVDDRFGAVLRGCRIVGRRLLEIALGETYHFGRARRA